MIELKYTFTQLTLVRKKKKLKALNHHLKSSERGGRSLMVKQLLLLL